EVYKVGAMVSPRPQDQTSSDIEGHFALTDLRPDQPVRLRVQAQGFGTVSLSTVRPPTDEPIEIVLLPSGSIAGRVVDPSGRPVEQAHLSARPEHPIATSASSASASSASATSDAEGRFRLPELEPRPQRIEVSARSYQSQILRSIEPSVDGEPRFEIVLEPGAAVEGRITWEDDRPVVEASVSVRPLGVPPFGLPDAPSRSDTEGRFRVDGVALGSALIAVHLAGRERLQRQVEIEPGTNTVDLRLERGFEVSGRVLDAEGNPATGAALWLQQSRYLARIYRRQPQAVSTSDGSFKVPDITVGAYRLTAEKEGFYPASSELFEVAGDVAGVELTLRRGAVLQGEILNLDFDQLAALAISVNGEAGARRGRIDFAGSYKVDNLSPGSWRIRAQVAGAGRAALIRTVEIPEGATEVRQDLDFRTGFTLSGGVVDNGEPLVEAHVAALSTRGIGETTTDFAGRFRIDHLEAGSYQLRVMSSTVAPLHVRRLEIVADHELQIELATGSLAGTVTDSTRGRPLAGAAVALERLDARAEPSPFNRPSFRRTHSDSRGRFRFESLRSGDWQLVASRPGYAPFETLATVTGASEIDVPMAPAAGVSFTVTTDAGPPSAVHAAIVDPAGRVVAGGAHPVVDGKVKVTTVPPGQWDLLLQTGESAVTRVAVTAPGDQGQVHLPLGGGLRFELRELVDVLAARLLVTGPDGQPLIIPRSLYYPPGERTLAMGKTVLWHLHPGVWSYTVLHPDGRAWRGSATVTPGSTTVVRQVPGD
ncbi:MAG: carboxypeptidase-like regulatory domain-containing protein, partial [Acidobacteriota bacterium]